MLFGSTLYSFSTFKIILFLEAFKIFWFEILRNWFFNLYPGAMSIKQVFKGVLPYYTKILFLKNFTRS